MATASALEKTYDTVIGLEVHVQLKTASKLFCSCPTDFGATPNSNVCPVCTGQPGVLPVLNRKAVESAVKVGLALGCRINEKSYFARKQYFYPDLPKAYQISQSDQPVCLDGLIQIESGSKKIRVQRIHIEEDAGKLVHTIGSTELSYSLVDLNRSSVPLIEIVSHPDLSSSEEAHQYLSVLKATVQYIGVSDCDMEKGSLRCDANISVKRTGTEKLGTRVEVKNMNSFRAVKDAIDYEVARQIELVEGGGTVVQETRLWNEAQGATFSMRSKEEAHDYRYFPEPDLLTLHLDKAWVEKLRSELPELPQARRQRFVQVLGLSDYDAGVLSSERALADYFEAALNALPAGLRSASAKPVSNWITTELMGRLNADKLEIDRSPVPPAAIAELVELVQAGTISGKMAKDIFSDVYGGGGSPKSIVAKKGLSQVSDEGELLKYVDEVIAENPKVAADVKGGKMAAVGSLVGQLMKKTKGRANPQLANELFKKRLGAA